MGKIKIYEIAKKLNLPSKDVLNVAQSMNLNVKNHLASIDEEEAKKLENVLLNKSDISKITNESEKNEQVGTTEINKQEKNKIQEKSKDTIELNKNEKGPVIIRREVIISDDDSKNNMEKKKKENNYGSVERRNKDFNIVYRNKPNKPKTVDELFGLNRSKSKVDERKPQEHKIQENQEKQVQENNKVDVKMNEKSSNQEMVKTNNQKENNNQLNLSNKNYDKNNERNFGKNNDGLLDKNRNRNNYDRSGDRNRDRNSDSRFDRNRDRNDKNFDKNRNKNDKDGFRKNNKFKDGNNTNKFNGRRPLDEKGIEKNIKNIMTAESMPEKEVIRDYSKNIDKQKINNKFNEPKKKNKSRKNEGKFDEGKLKSLKQTNKLSNMFDDQNGEMLDYYDLTTQRGRKGKKKNQKQEERNKQKIFDLTEIEIPDTITVKDLAQELKKTTAEVIKKLFNYGIMATINQEIDFDTAFLVAGEFGVTAKKKETVTDEDILFDDSEDKEEDLKPRPPVVVVMGHVDHGKTSLLDAIRKTNVISGEAGGITQAIGAYKVKINNREITFLDTPGHEAFTAMRARGAQITDIAILVVAANDGVMPQTVEAINHAKSAGIPIIVAINKIDLPDANPDRVKQELMTYGLVPEEWGGDTICVPISAKNHTNIDQLLEMVLLEADVLELKANPNKQSKGVVIEARLDKSKGAIATMLVQRGKLDIGDTIIVGSSIGRIRSMTDENGKKVKSAGPSTPVEIMGLTEVPEAGDTFYEVKDEKTAKHLIEKRKREAREKAIGQNNKVTLDNLFSQMEAGKIKTLNLIIKADVQGSVEAVKQSMEKLHNDEVKVNVIHAAPGAVNDSDVILAKVSNAIIIAFNVRPIPDAKDMAEKEGVEIKQYSVIYQAIDEVEAAMNGMLAPKYEEKIIGTAEVRQIFKISNVGTIAGCFVTTGKVERNAGVRVIRDNIVIHDGKLVSLKRFKDEAKEVAKGFECGVQIEDYDDIKEGDTIEAYVMEEIKR